MRFPRSFTRYVGAVPAGGVALGGDSSLPAGRASAAKDNVLFSRFQNVNGWPCHRIACTYRGPGGAPSAVARVFFYEDSTAAWYQVGADVTMPPGKVSFFDCIAILEMANTSQNLQDATPGSSALLLQVDLPTGTPPNGAYVFALAPDLTTQA